MVKASIRKRRNNKSIIKANSLFSEYIKKGKYRMAGKVVFWCVLECFAKEDIMNALNQANNFIKRRKRLNHF